MAHASSAATIAASLAILLARDDRYGAFAATFTGTSTVAEWIAGTASAVLAAVSRVAAERPVAPELVLAHVAPFILDCVQHDRRVPSLRTIEDVSIVFAHQL